MIFKILLIYSLLWCPSFNSSVDDVPTFKSNSSQLESTWKRSSCYPGISYRLSTIGTNNDGSKRIWIIEYRNNYSETAYFNYDLFEERKPGIRTRNRTRLTANHQSISNKEFYLPLGVTPVVVIEKLRFTKDDQSPYIPCSSR